MTRLLPPLPDPPGGDVTSLTGETDLSDALSSAALEVSSPLTVSTVWRRSALRLALPVPAEVDGVGSPSP